MEYKEIRVDNNKRVPKEGVYHAIWPDGKQGWYVNGQRHRDDGPAMTWPDGHQEWWVKGQWHREDGPAVIRPDGSQVWLIKGQYHRADGPAVIWANGFQEWYVNGQLHREDGPAIIDPDGSQEWWLNGLLHRADGPAVIYSNGNKEWWINGNEVHEKAVENPKELTIKDIVKWENIEGQREMIRIYGLERFIRDSNPDIVHMDYHDMNGHRALLKVYDIIGQWLCCSCPSTGRVYFMGVPDDINTCQKADEWLSGSIRIKQIGRT